MPELLGRLPVKINLTALTKEEFKLILTEVEFSLLEQHTRMMGTEDIKIDFTDGGINLICKCKKIKKN